MGRWVSLADKNNPSGLSNKVQWKEEIYYLYLLTSLITIWCGKEKDIVVLKKSFKIKPKKVQVSKDGDLYPVLFFKTNIERSFIDFIQWVVNQAAVQNERLL